MTPRLVAILAALGLSGCFNETANLGAPPPVLLDTTRVVVAAPRGGVPSRARLRDGILAVAEGQAQSVRADIHLRGVREGEAARRALVGLGLDPARVAVEPLLPGASVPPAVILSRTAAWTRPCADAIEPGTYGDPAPSLMSLAHCQQANNLAQMLVDPKDLAAPPRLADQDGAYLVDGVQAWRTNRATPLPAQNTTIGDAGPGASTAGAAPVAAVPTATIPSATVSATGLAGTGDAAPATAQ